MRRNKSIPADRIAEIWTDLTGEVIDATFAQDSWPLSPACDEVDPSFNGHPTLMDNREKLIQFAEETIDPYVNDLLRNIKYPKNRKDSAYNNYVRGIDYYGTDAPNILINSLLRYYVVRKELPAHPYDCKSIIEKIFWSKFFVPLPLPTPADKLAVGAFIPDHLRDEIQPAEIVWSSTQDDIPSDLNGLEGQFFLKSNHGYGTLEPVNYPLSDMEQHRLSTIGRAWLRRKPYNYIGGEWWYSTIKPKIYLERKIENRSDGGMEFKFWVVSGKTLCVLRPASSDPQHADSVDHFDTTSVYDATGKYLPDISYRGRKSKTIPVSEDFERMRDMAESLGSFFEFVRVDFYNPTRGVVILGELTLCPTEGCGSFSPAQYENELGQHWDFRRHVDRP